MPLMAGSTTAVSGRFFELSEEVRAEFPDLLFKYKDESPLMKLLNAFLLFVTFGQQKTFMTHFITTVGHTIYLPVIWDSMTEWARCSVLRHERVHMRQQKRYGTVLFAVLYILPFFPLGLAYFRARFEWEAYRETMQVSFEQHGSRMLKDAKYKEYIVSFFVTGAYGWMWPFRRTVEGWYDEAVKEILS